MFCKKDVLENFAHRKTPLSESLRPATLFETLAPFFFCKLCKISKNTFFIEHLRWLLLTV